MTQQKVIGGIAVLGVLTGIIVIGSQTILGSKVSSEVNALQATLIARDDVQVERFEYDKGLASGTLHYDVEFRPEKHHPLFEVIAGLSTDPDMPALRIHGDLDVRHGSFGNGMTFALATAEERIMLPDSWRQHLPQYPAETPLVTITGSLALDGALHVQTEGTDYSGTLLGATQGDRGSLSVSDWGGFIAANRTKDELTLEGRLGDLSVDIEQEGVHLALRDLALSMHGYEHLPKLWLGESGVRIGYIAFDIDGERARVNDIEMLIDATAEQDRIDQVVTVNIGETTADDYVFKGASLVTAFRGLDEKALQTLAEIADQLNHGAPGDLDAETERMLLTAIEQLLDSGLSISVDRLSLHLAEQDDLSASVAMSYPEGADVNFSRPDLMLDSLAMNASFEATSDALRVLTLMGAEMESRGVHKVNQAQIQHAGDAKYQEIMQMLVFLPYFNVDEQGVRSNLEIKSGMIHVNSQPLMPVAGLM